jgi:glycosyltransferase involved in cell wall biosynthesis
MPKPFNPKKILFTTSTLPSSDNDPVPAFVKDEAIWLKKIYPKTDITILAPHNAYSRTRKYIRHESYDEYRFHYFWPFRWEMLTGRGIQPALKKNKLLYFQLPGLFIAEFFATWKYVRKLKPDLLYAHWFTPQAITGALVAKITKTPFVFDTQASDAIVLKKVPFSKKIIASVCKAAAAYTAPSKQTVDKLLYFSTDKNREEILSKLHMVPYGTSPVAVSKTAISKTEEKYALKNKKVLYFIGRLVDRKGIDILIKAFADMSKEDPSLVLVIVGDGQERDKLIKLVGDLNLGKKVIFTGYINGEERFALLNLASVCVIPSVNVGDQAEGLPVVFMEAVTNGKVVVITDATGAHEFAQDGKNAFVAKAGSVKDLQKKLGQAIYMTSANEKKFKAEVKKLSEAFQWPSIIRRRYAAFTGKVKPAA